MSKSLPTRPHLDWYRKYAKLKLAELRKTRPEARLAVAQLAVAHEHGLSSWRKLKEHIDAVTLEMPKLIDAIRRNDGEQMKSLLIAHPELSRINDTQGQTALHFAAEDNNPDAVEVILKHGADTDAVYKYSAHSALSWALTVRSFDSANALVRSGVKPDLFCAAGLGDVELVRSFFDKQGNLRRGASQTGSTRYSSDNSLLPCPPKSSREIISDALYLASRNGRTEAVRELLRHDPDLSFRAYIGGTPLHWAYFDGQPEVIELLLRAGADVTILDSVYRCVPRAFGICVASSWGFAHIVFRQLKFDHTLVNIVGGRGTPLHEAARSGNVAIIRLLLQNGADRSIRDPDGKTPLELAGENQQVQRELGVV
jgi:ankyrin repeat protein